MGGAFQIIELASKELAIYATLMLIGFLIGRIFKTLERRRILIGITLACLAAGALFVE